MELTVRLRPQSYQVPRHADPPQRRRQVAEALLILSPVGGELDSPSALWIQLVLGIGLFVLSFRFDPKRRKKPRRSPEVARTCDIGFLVSRMADRTGTPRGIGRSRHDASCVVMVLPAGVLLTARIASRSRIEPILHRMNAWITEKAGSATGWVLAIAGFLIARDAVARLWFPHLLGQG